MRGFLPLLAENLYERYGDDISSLSIIFPSRRARLFFMDALSGLIRKPLWQPAFLTVDELMQQYGSLELAERIPLIADLYGVYSRFHKESFDSFWYWGEMLLSDFDSIDKYMIDAGQLFRNVADLKEMDGDTSYLTPEQAQIVERFWNSFGHEESYSAEKRKFIDIWSTLSSVYEGYRALLTEKGTGYGGMVYRRAAENIRAGIMPDIPPRRIVIAGFNALSQSEKVLFMHLQATGQAEFFWDHDDYYTKDPAQEAGLFIRENLALFPQKEPLGPTANFSAHKNITVVSSPSDSLQCKYAGKVLGDLCACGDVPDKDTAIVLTDENLMVPVLSSIPDKVPDINVTMGYPLKLTPAYTLFERLAELQSCKRVKADRVSFRYGDLTGILSHPLTAGMDTGTAQRIKDALRRRQLMYSDVSELLPADSPLAALLRDGGEGVENLSGYLLGALSAVLSSGAASGEGRGQDRDHLALMADNIRRTAGSLRACALEVSDKVFISLLRKILQTVRIPFEGEPLKGIQVMGILETRNLDFRNLIVLSMNDDNFPGNRLTSYSFIPHNLRFAYGLPTPAHHEGVYAYYFYRLLQRAENVHLVYSSRADEKSSGEQSRYIYQLAYESPHRIARVDIGLDINVAPGAPVAVDKSGDAARVLEAFLSGEKQLSPSSFNNYVACPLKFYFHTVAGLREEEEPEEEIDAPMFGTILHRAMDLLYRPLSGIDDPRAEISALIGTATVREAVEEAVRKEYLRGESLPAGEYGGNLLLVTDIITRYIDKCILPFDTAQEPFTIWKTEHPVGAEFPFAVDGTVRTVRFCGSADRIDILPDGRARVVDYKTGREELTFNGLEALFSPLAKERNPAALQTMLYGLMISRGEGRDVTPALYYVRSLNGEGYSPLLKDRSMKADVISYRAYSDPFEELLAGKLAELFDPRAPFTQCEDVKTCQFCDFRDICRR